MKDACALCISRQLPTQAVLTNVGINETIYIPDCVYPKGQIAVSVCVICSEAAADREGCFLSPFPSVGVSCVMLCVDEWLEESLGKG